MREATVIISLLNFASQNNRLSASVWTLWGWWWAQSQNQCRDRETKWSLSLQELRKQWYELAICKNDVFMVKSLGNRCCITCMLIYTFAKICLYPIKIKYNQKRICSQSTKLTRSIHLNASLLIFLSPNIHLLHMHTHIHSKSSHVCKYKFIKAFWCIIWCCIMWFNHTAL